MIAVRWAFREGHFVLRAHAHIEMLMEGLTLGEFQSAAANGDLLEEYPDRPEGYTKLVLGYVNTRPITSY
jgi:hypothetical protein